MMKMTKIVDNEEKERGGIKVKSESVRLHINRWIIISHRAHRAELR
jgi:hypothetical protein